MAGGNKKVIGTDFTTGQIMPLLIKFFLPMLAANILNSIYNTVDTIIIGQFVGSAGIVSVNMGGKMLNMFTHFGIAFAGGGQVLIAQLVGAKREDKVKQTIGTLFDMMAVLAILGAALMLIFAVPILKLLNTPEEAFDGALGYLRVTAIGLIFMFGYNAVSSILAGMGESKKPLIFVAIAAVVNLIGDIIFIVVFHLDAVGTAIATVLGQAVSLIISLIYLYRRREDFGFDFKLPSFKADWEMLKIMVKIGFPNALRSLCITVTQLYLLGNVNVYGVTESAAYSIGDKIYHLANVFVTSIGNGASGMVGQNLGAGKNHRVKTVVFDTFILSLAGAVLLSVISLLFPKQIFGLFTKDPAVLAYAPPFMMISALIYLLCCFMVTFNAITTAAGKSVLNFLGGILDGIIFRISFSMLFATVLGWGVIGYFMGEALARLGPPIVSGIYYFSRRWEKTGQLIKKKEEAA